MRDYYEFDAALHCPPAATELRRQHAENEQLKAERDALRKAIRFLFDHGAYLTERVPDHLQAAIDAAREKP